MSDIIPWAREYGDDEKQLRFAGRFVGYDPQLVAPNQKIPVDKPIVLLLADSIFGGSVWQGIRDLIAPKAFISYIQHPHHAGNISPWLDLWDMDQCDHYRVLFNFEGMHGFPPRQTLETHLQDTTKLVRRYKKVFHSIIWGNMVPIPAGFKMGVPSSAKGPNSIEQDIRDNVVVDFNASLDRIMKAENIPLVDIYSLIKSHPGYQRYDDLHLTQEGNKILSELTSNAILREL